MTDPIGPSARFRTELDGGEVIEADGEALTLRLPAPRAHGLAHLVDEWSRMFGATQGKGAAAANRELVRALEDGAAVLGEAGALRCATRVAGSVSVGQRVAAVGLLAEREPDLSALERVAVVDAAARWLDEEAGDELAFALLGAACSSEVVATAAYLALLAPASPEPEGAST